MREKRDVVNAATAENEVPWRPASAYKETGSQQTLLNSGRFFTASQEEGRKKEFQQTVGGEWK